MAALHSAKRGQAYDTLLLAWLNSHPYFRELISHILASRLYVPEVTNAAQVGNSRVASELAANVARNCLDRLAKVNFASQKASAFEQSVRRRVADIARDLGSPDVDSKKLVDLVQDSVVIPSFLEAEQLPFDPVTFQHLLKIVGEFYAAAATTSHPDFDGRVVFSTCDFTPSPADDSAAEITAVQHHGVGFARPQFAVSLTNAYNRVAGASGGYGDAYALRAIVCVNLRVQPPVFAACLKDLMTTGESAELTIYTELPFTPPPPGESYVVVGGRRIGKLKLVPNRGG